MRSPITEKVLGVIKDEEKFSEVRHKASSKPVKKLKQIKGARGRKKNA